MSEFVYPEDERPVSYRDIQWELSVLFTTVPYFERPHMFTLPGDDNLIKDSVTEGQFCDALVWDVADALDKNENITAHVDLVYGTFSHSMPITAEERLQSEALHSLREFAKQRCVEPRDNVGDLADDYHEAVTGNRTLQYGTVGRESGVYAITKDGEGAGVQYVIAPGLSIDFYPGSIRNDEYEELRRMTYVTLRADSSVIN